MSYTRKPRLAAPMGDLASTLSTMASVAGVASDLMADPYLPETVCRIGQIKAAQHGQPAQPCAKTPDGLSGGVGLRKAMPAIRGVAYAEQHKWVYPVAIGAAIGLPMLLGYWLGKGS